MILMKLLVGIKYDFVHIYDYSNKPKYFSHGFKVNPIFWLHSTLLHFTCILHQEKKNFQSSKVTSQ